MTSIPNANIRNTYINASHPSHLPPIPLPAQPLPASLLLSQDPRLSRRRAHNRNELFSTGCRELDSHVLLNPGGFERGSVVGLSCEEEETIGLGIGLQVVARMLFLSSGSDDHDVVASEGSKGEVKGMKAMGRGMGKGKAMGKAMIITTLSTTSLLPRLRLALVSEARVLQGNGSGNGNGNGQQKQVDRGMIKSCLERVLVARVFDAEGLREVLRELEGDGDVDIDEAGSSSEEREKQQRQQGNDTEGENQSSEAESSKGNSKHDNLPDLILITNTSHLLNTLFTRNKTGSNRFAAHNSAVQLSDQIRALSRRGPLVMMLNSTTSPTTNSSNSTSLFDDNRGPKQPDLSIMRSIFNPPPPAPMEAAPGYMAGLVGSGTATAPSGSYRGGGYGGHGGRGGYGNHLQTQTQVGTAAAASRRNKPSYGMVFSQMLNLHLLCTKVPRGRSRHGGHGGYGGYGEYGGYGGYVWAVEVLLDELGVYEGLDGILGEAREEEGEGEQQEEGKGRRGLIRRSREQRWGAVEIEEGSGRVVDAFR